MLHQYLHKTHGQGEHDKHQNPMTTAPKRDARRHNRVLLSFGEIVPRRQLRKRNKHALPIWISQRLINKCFTIAGKT